MWLVSFRPISAWIKWRAVKECVILRELAPAFMGLEAPVGSMGEGAIKVTLHCLVAFHFKCFRNFSIFSRTDQEWMWYGNPNILVGYWSCTFHHKTLLFATKQLNEVCLPFPFEEGGWLPSFLFALLGSLLQRQWWSGLDSWLGGLALAVIGDITLDAGRGDEVMMRHSHSSPVTIYLACLLYTCAVYTPKHESHWRRHYHRFSCRPMDIATKSPGRRTYKELFE